MRSPKDYVLLKIERKSDDSILIGNQTLFLYNGELNLKDGSYNPNDRTRIYGEVVSVPDSLSNTPMDYSDRLLSDCTIEVLPSDKAYFYYICLNDDNLLTIEGVMYLKVRYDNIICVVRGGVIIPISGHVLVSKVKKKETAILYEVEKVREFIGKVEHVPSSYIGDNLDIVQGDIIQFYENSDFENEIEGVKYYCMRSEFIIAKVV